MVFSTDKIHSSKRRMQVSKMVEEGRGTTQKARRQSLYLTLESMKE